MWFTPINSSDRNLFYSQLFFKVNYVFLFRKQTYLSKFLDFCENENSSLT